MQVMREQRLDHRLGRHLPLFIESDKIGRISGETVDLSNRGLSCRVRCHVPPFSRLSVELQVPIPFRGLSSISLEAFVVRVERDSTAVDAEGFVLGCFFLQLDQEKADLISQFFNALKAHSQAPQETNPTRITEHNCLSPDFNPQGFLKGCELTRLDRLACLGELSSVLAHEIKNPLACLAGSLQVLEEEIRAVYPSDDLFAELFGQIERIDTIVDHLLHFSATEAPQMKPIRLDDVINGTLSLLDGKLKEKNVKVDLCHGDTQPRVFADERLLRQAFLNLFANVVDDIQVDGHFCINTHWQGKAPVCGRSTCECFAQGKEQGISVVVMDFSERVKTAGLKGRQLPIAERKKRGLNLSMTQQIIEQHKGSVFIQNQPMESSALLVNLPI